jgi:alkylation response protein AidB-like acyl-CoA dehydrogenase
VPASTATGATAFARWQALQQTLTRQWQQPIERAICGGFHSTSCSDAFSFGYQAALQQLVPGRIGFHPASFCVTEAGGNRPSAIATTLKAQAAGHWILQGEKSFVSGAEHARDLLVAATTGQDQQGRNQLAMVLIPARQTGVTINLLPPLPFVPEVSHGNARFDQVVVTEDQRLPGDGYTDYIKPFRTLEDIQVSAALLGMLLRIARQYAWPRTAIETLLAGISLHQAMAALPAGASSTHLLLAGARTQMQDWLTSHASCWNLCPPALAQEWQRDSALLQIAAKARLQRTESAWAVLSAAPP